MIFSRKLEGGTGIQGVSPNLNLVKVNESFYNQVLLHTRCELPRRIRDCGQSMIQRGAAVGHGTLEMSKIYIIHDM